MLLPGWLHIPHGWHVRHGDAKFGDPPPIMSPMMFFESSSELSPLPGCEPTLPGVKDGKKGVSAMRNATAEILDSPAPEHNPGAVWDLADQSDDAEKAAHRYIARILNQGISINVAIKEEALFDDDKRSRICCEVAYGSACAKWNFPVGDLDRAGVSLHAMIDTIIEHLLREQISQDRSAAG
jgi:hypothetical protein